MLTGLASRQKTKFGTQEHQQFAPTNGTGRKRLCSLGILWLVYLAVGLPFNRAAKSAAKRAPRLSTWAGALSCLHSGRTNGRFYSCDACSAREGFGLCDVYAASRTALSDAQVGASRREVSRLTTRRGACTSWWPHPANASLWVRVLGLPQSGCSRVPHPCRRAELRRCQPGTGLAMRYLAPRLFQGRVATQADPDFVARRHRTCNRQAFSSPRAPIISF
jgi:hypothetical protein